MSIHKFSICALSVEDPGDFIPPHSNCFPTVDSLLYSYILKLAVYLPKLITIGKENERIWPFSTSNFSNSAQLRL